MNPNLLAWLQGGGDRQFTSCVDVRGLTLMLVDWGQRSTVSRTVSLGELSKVKFDLVDKSIEILIEAWEQQFGVGSMI